MKSRINPRPTDFNVLVTAFPMAKSEEELETLDESERGESRNCLKTQHSEK